jgi:exopolysaccharide production negative regulator
MRLLRGLLAAALLATAGGAAAQQDPVGQSALKRGLSAYQKGQQETAIPALTEVAATGDASAKFLAEFYLARAYAEGAGAAANHTKAYVLYRKIADENVEVPERSQRAAYVAKTLIALAGYVRSGLKEIDLPANPRGAARYLEHAATYFGDKDAQYQLARTYLGADGWSSGEISLGLHYLSVLTQAGHPAAQATLADLFWHGRHVRKDEARALALAGIAMANAPEHERKWIEASYASMFCATPAPKRQAAGGLADRWRKMLARPESEPAGLTAGDLLPDRPCPDSEAVVAAPPPRAETIRSAVMLDKAAKKK